ncbi:MAG: Asp-tRNA(Asn)/Glu-tRNA(Gln) amidotransferase subunit GatB [Calditrichae bacterium]|nr:Asp-tRNA(Asn)/Glu-tRNA(Gln) amidotransferase subunit GatB [Calditrichota bacterium]MCB9059092.1 Asp-tRNA(Asn)/Glu-tRNA(Gln) amidotransferase subunit GatB [Calditrichia bacterium]
MKYEVVIGLEVHAQLATNTKIFCGCSTRFGSEPNTQVCPVCLGLPGSLPVLNNQVVEFAIKMGLATDSQITRLNKFARKNYFYPDLPKGYQISQFEEPICEHGYVDIHVDDQHKRIGITRIHMEEDAGKSVHDEGYVNKDETLIDLNRCGVPLIEIVSEPDIRSAKEAAAYLTKIRQLVRYLGICDGNMEEGSLRCDANISLRPFGQKEFGTKTELKNMNSIRNVERAIEYEIKRQTYILEDGEKVIQETLLWDPVKNEARPMRSKEESHDYRYFPDPDLVPVKISQEWLDNIHNALPELPDVKSKRFTEEYSLPEYDAEVLTASRDIADYFETTAKSVKNSKLVSNWVMGEVMRLLNQQKTEIDHIGISPARLSDLLNAIDQNVISGSAAKTVFEKLAESDLSVAEIIEQKGLKQVSDSGALDSWIDQVIAENRPQVERYKNGETKLLGFFVGSIMKASKGKADPKLTNELLRKKLSEL